MANMNENVGFNYYYGVKDNADLIRWMKDIDHSIHELYKDTDLYREAVNHNADILEKVQDRVEKHKDIINYNADLLDNVQKSVKGLAWGVAALSLLTGCAILLQAMINDDNDQRMDGYENAMKDVRRRLEEIEFNVK